jgi:hypothetical protein
MPSTRLLGSAAAARLRRNPVRRNCCRRRSATCDLSVEGGRGTVRQIQSISPVLASLQRPRLYLTGPILGRRPCHQRGCSDSGASAARIPAAAARWISSQTLNRMSRYAGGSNFVSLDFVSLTTGVSVRPQGHDSDRPGRRSSSSCLQPHSTVLNARRATPTKHYRASDRGDDNVS